MTPSTIEQIYDQVIKPLSAADRLRLVEKIAHDLSFQPGPEQSTQRPNWQSIRGIAPDLLGGEDAQAWVSRTRRESDEHREKQWRRET